ncbi:5-methylcytosine-specific restriction endonuclease McrA [Rhizobium mesoamericanum]|uniref:HNH endonuclease n=1 Tax=Rhizobium mesoamericanum TaxID=1079800 RepID=UPI002785F676|nr:HNH endonuclease [Rhizobium mesoamericanum]MDQ0558321.1 5-methylcytosine-specific restriction endonuclease McrA [Rhizobium mesoamericanum]
MAKLNTINPLVSTLPPLIGRAKGEKARDQHRRQTQPWRAWYNTARWERLRRQAFERDLYTCQRSGEMCAGTGNDPNSPVANHRIPHHGNPSLFWDIDNIETVTKRIHDGIIQSEERRSAIEGQWGD